MSCSRPIAVVALFACLGSPASAQSAGDKVTVTSLLHQGYAVAGTVSSPAGGAGLLLRNDAKLYFCFVAETPQSATVETRYCKPVD